MKVRKIIGILETHGFRLERQKGSHRHFIRQANGRNWLVTVSGSDNDDVPKGTLGSIRRQSGLPRKLFR